jgi:hypothetical protein
LAKSSASADGPVRGIDLLQRINGPSGFEVGPPHFDPDSEKSLAIPITPGHKQKASVASLRPR